VFRFVSQTICSSYPPLSTIRRPSISSRRCTDLEQSSAAYHFCSVTSRLLRSLGDILLRTLLSCPQSDTVIYGHVNLSYLLTYLLTYFQRPTIQTVMGRYSEVNRMILRKRSTARHAAQQYPSLAVLPRDAVARRLSVCLSVRHKPLL